jgi:hypothetical protein
MAAGEPEEARAHYQRAAAASRRMGDGARLARAAFGLGREFTAGAVDELEVELLEETRPDEARQQLEPLTADDFAGLPRNHLYLYHLAVLAIACHALDDRPRGGAAVRAPPPLQRPPGRRRRHAQALRATSGKHSDLTKRRATMGCSATVARPVRCK